MSKLDISKLPNAAKLVFEQRDKVEQSLRWAQEDNKQKDIDYYQGRLDGIDKIAELAGLKRPD